VANGKSFSIQVGLKSFGGRGEGLGHDIVLEVYTDQKWIVPLRRK
jgi:hypothetical protein